jgi:predicted nucleic acid-binding protein
VIVADTGAVVALIDADDRHHASLRGAFEADPDAWVLP